MMKKWIYVLITVVVIVLTIFLYFIFNKKTQEVTAGSVTSSITSQAQWQGGVNSALLDTTTTPGGIKINVSGGITQIDTSSAILSSDVDSGNIGKVIDGGDYTGWGFTSTYEDECHWWKMDLGSNVLGISRIRNQGGGDADSSQKILFSVDDSTYNLIFTGAGGPGVPWVHDIPTAQTARYVKVEACNEYYYPAPTDNVGENELTIYQGPFRATNMETLDGGENFWDWETFADTKTVPANTAVTYRYRSSANGSSWNAWHSSFDDVESRSGDTKYRYLQVEATLTNTDGVSTPTIDSYSIDYHTELKPTAPTAQTAVVR